MNQSLTTNTPSTAKSNNQEHFILHQSPKAKDHWRKMRRYCTVSPYETVNAKDRTRKEGYQVTPSPGGKMRLPKTIRREDALLQEVRPRSF
ncbi:hypothetical protein CDAR_365261 [Caerostris darwini]|uniref:Uncharacterized protein n=1 Tax=Caerostris darwini TaxID=1538125 RepID=A0AAV4U8H7_9ARAC|nr:hypothetical protein CDAR_365261 [Caerostris darwini]